MVGKRSTNGGARFIYLQLITKIPKVACAAIMRYRIVEPGGGCDRCDPPCDPNNG